MQTIKYKFADGTTNEVEITEDIYLIHLELLQQEKRNHWKETRRHTSLYYFTDMGIDFEDKQTENPLELYIRKENIASIRKAMSYLTDKRRKLIHKVFFEEKTFRAIAREQGLSKSAISQRMKTIYKHLRKHLGALRYGKRTVSSRCVYRVTPKGRLAYDKRTLVCQGVGSK